MSGALLRSTLRALPSTTACFVKHGLAWVCSPSFFFYAALAIFSVCSLCSFSGLLFDASDRLVGFGANVGSFVLFALVTAFRHPKLFFNPKPTHSFWSYLGLRHRRSKPVRARGTCDRAFRNVKKRFERNFAEFDEVGAAVCVYVDGKKVVDLWGGVADVTTNKPWEEDTLVNVFSTGKGLESLCVAKLVSEGKLDYDAPVARYWPEFAQEGKESVTVGQLMRHEAGLVAVDDPAYRTVDNLLQYLDLEDGRADEKMDRFADILAKQKPFWKIDGRHGYHALSRGFYVSQLIRKVDPKKRSIHRYFNEEIAEPLGVDFYFVLPQEQRRRCARLVGRPLLWTVVESIFPLFTHRDFWGKDFYKAMLNPQSISRKTFDTPVELNGVKHLQAYNSDPVFSLEASSCAGCSTARALAKVYNITNFDDEKRKRSSSFSAPSRNPETPGDESDNSTVQSDVNAETGSLKICPLGQMEEEAKQIRYTMDEVMRIPTGFTRGGWTKVKEDWPHVVASCGFGGSLAFVDLKHRFSFAYVMNMMGPMDVEQAWLDKRATLLADEVYKSLLRIESKNNNK